LAQPIIEVRDLKKGYGNNPLVLEDLSLSFHPGEFTTILGLSGSGKSTFLRCLNRLVEPSGGKILIPSSILEHGEILEDEKPELDIVTLPLGPLRLWRRRVGMIFQQFNLAKRLSVLDNVLSGGLGSANLFPSSLRLFSTQTREQAFRNLDRIGLLDRAYQRADTLSGGQQQRVAIARALMQKPRVILADEPVASLDPKLSVTILDILRRIAREDDISVIISLHTLELAKNYSDRIVGLSGGRIVFDGKPDRLEKEAIDRIYQREGSERARSHAPAL
jgi:phosphonate transport system ATP-binding protein